MPQSPHEMPQGMSHRGITGPSTLLSPFLPTATPGGPLDEEQHEFADSSAPLLNMYREMAEEEDNRIAEHRQNDTGGILIFVSSQPPFDITLHIKSTHID
jgi:hypothetical protein